MDVTEIHERAPSVFADVLLHVADEDLGSATPCSDWTVADLIDHVVQGNLTTAARIGTEAPTTTLPSGDRIAVHAAVAEQANAALREPRWRDRRVGLPFPGSASCGPWPPPWTSRSGMAVLWALLPAPAAAAIERRLAHEAKALGADDPRTMAQRRADLLAAWLSTNEAGEAAIHAQIAVKLPADVLAHEFVGRLAPDTLKLAVQFRDGVCQAPGCLRPADQCDNDHREPWPEGLTSGVNIWPLCRRHHILKGH